MKISIIVTIYNKKEYLRDCIESLVNQTWVTKGLGELEILLIDDGSSDGSEKICDEYDTTTTCQEESDSKKSALTANGLCVRAIHKPNGGLVSAWRCGTEEATGDYISYVDSDDWIDVTFCEKLAEYATGRDDEMIMCDYVIERCEGKEPSAGDYMYQNIAPGEYLREDICSRILPVLWGLEDRAISRSRCMKLISAKLARDNMHYGDFRLRFAEDTSLSIPCVLSAGRIYILDHEALYHYRQVGDSMIHSYDRTMYESIQLVQKITEQAILDKKNMLPQMDLIEICRKEYIFLLMFAVKNEAKLSVKEAFQGIKAICLEPENRRLIKNQEITVNRMGNRLVYLVMKHPNRIMCSVLTAAMRR